MGFQITCTTERSSKKWILPHPPPLKHECVPPTWSPEDIGLRTPATPPAENRISDSLPHADWDGWQQAVAAGGVALGGVDGVTAGTW